jgi:hypothetical protein
MDALPNDLCLRRDIMKRSLLSVIVAGLLCTTSPAPALGGVEPSPFLPDISIIQLRLLLIKQIFTLPDPIVASLATIDLRLASIEQDPQQKPWITPEMTTQGVGAIDRISAILINPQPEPPALPADPHALSVTVMYEVAVELARTAATGLTSGTIPGLNALEQLSAHLQDAVVDEQLKRAAAQVNAMSRIVEKYAAY